VIIRLYSMSWNAEKVPCIISHLFGHRYPPGKEILPTCEEIKKMRGGK
jgi:hypothetical protein